MTAPYAPPLNVPSKPQVDGAAGGRNQKDRRYMDTFWDQHRHPRFPKGRPWCGPREIAANHDLMHEDGFCMGDLMQGEYVEHEDGSIDRGATLRAAWSSPWRPLAKYFKYNYKRKTIAFLYPQMRLDEDQGLQRYYRAASKLGIQLNLRVEPGIIPHPQIVSELGEPSRMIKIAEAAMAGDPWLLAFIDEPNPDLADILGIHAASGIALYQSYEPPVVQAQKVEAVLAAPANQDLLQMIAEMAATAAAAAVDRAFQRRDAEAVATKARNRVKMAPVRAARSHHRSPQEPAA